MTLSQRAGVVLCPECGAVATAITTRHGLRHDCCGLWSWGGKPLVSAATHAARRQAHDAFDDLWKYKLTSRSQAYKLLAAELGLAPQACHIALMDEATARRVPAAAAAIRKRLVAP